MSHTVYSAVLQFNEGQFGLVKVYENFWMLRRFIFSDIILIQTGVCFNIISEKMNRRSIQNLLIKTSDKSKSKRKKLKAIKKGLLDKVLHQEGGETYLKGGF